LAGFLFFTGLPPDLYDHWKPFPEKGKGIPPRECNGDIPDLFFQRPGGLFRYTGDEGNLFLQVIIMKFAILSDIHGNLEAFLAVLKDLRQFLVDRVFCLGDLIGYGPDPEEVVKVVIKRGIPSVMGNHELGLADSSYLRWFNPSTKRSLLLTKKLISPETLEYLCRLPRVMSFRGCLFVHGCPPDSITTYLFELSPVGLEEIFNSMKERIAFVGHTHDLSLNYFDGRKVRTKTVGQGLHPLMEELQYIINIGSVGQPRDGNNNAKYVLYDDHHHLLEVRFVPYDISVTAKKILEWGFPEYNAQRLF
jgi:predicted phosphodiesterase